jgi:cell shape-determining protein MreC
MAMIIIIATAVTTIAAAVTIVTGGIQGIRFGLRRYKRYREEKAAQQEELRHEREAQQEKIRELEERLTRIEKGLAA